MQRGAPPEYDGAEGGDAEVRLEVLGSLRLLVDGREVEVPGVKRRAVLVMLARAEGRLVTVDDLLDAVWPSMIPVSGRAALQSHVSRLRGHLGPASWRLQSVDGGYRLVLGDGSLDAAQARDVRAHVLASGEHDPAAAVRSLREALALWRGPMLPDLGDIAPISAWMRALDELCRDIGDRLVAALLRSGDISGAVDVATDRVADDPLREPSVLSLMRALAAAGRGRDALRAGRELRRRLVEETGLDPSPALGELEREIASSATVPAARGGQPRPSLATSTTPLVGRDDDIAAIWRLLADERIVTILGPGGVGKTRVAAEIARTADDATVLALASVTDAAMIAHALAAAADLHVTHDDVVSACAMLLGSHRHLLVIDNCEHLLHEVRTLVTTLVERCPELRVLLTSREPLGVPLEHRYRLAPLPLPASDCSTTDLADVPSVAVFLDRARRARLDFAPDDGQLRTLAEIVRRLDGVPLAIELAAGRLSSLTLQDLHARLDRSLDLLGADSAAERRHRTLRDTIEWSYELLPDHERRLFRHLAVFPDGVTLATAEARATELGVPGDPGAALAHLVDTSMIDAVLNTSPARYAMLETLRSFALDRLSAEGERRSAEERLVRWAVDTAHWIEATAFTERETDADAALRCELPNLQTAWRRIRALGDIDRAISLVASLIEPATWREMSEIWSWADELVGDVPPDHQRFAVAVGAAATTAWIRGDLDRAVKLARRGLEDANDAEGRSTCLTVLADSELSRGSFDTALDLAIEAATCAIRPSENFGIAALASAYGGDVGRARRLNDRFAAVASTPTLRAMHHYVAGEIDNASGDDHPAEAHYTTAIELARRANASFVIGIASVGLLTVRVNAGRTREALCGYRDVIAYWEETGRWNQQWTTLRNLAHLLRNCGECDAAAFLDSAADHAPDAPLLTDTVGHRGNTESAPSGRLPEAMRVAAATARRAEVLDVAYDAIDRCLGDAPRGSPP